LCDNYLMDDPEVPWDWRAAVLRGRFSFLAMGGLILFCSLPAVCGQETPNTGARQTTTPDPCGSPINEKLTPFEDLLLDQVENAVRADPSKASDIVVKAIATDVSNPLNFPGHVMQRAIRALGQRVNQSNIAISVFGAVRARPSAVFETVRASIQATRAQLHPNIVAAAVAALADPYLRVETITVEEYFRETQRVARYPILWDRIRCVQGAQETVEEAALSCKTSTLPEALTLAEAIVDSAIQAGSSESLFDLQHAVNLVLQNGFAVSSLQGNPADSSTLITVPPPISPAPSTPTPTPPPISP
jgi:hypothetical protein